MPETVVHTIGEMEGTCQYLTMLFFQQELGYRYRGSMQEGGGVPNFFVEESVAFLVEEMGVEKKLATRAAEEFRRAVVNLTEGLGVANRNVYDLLKYGVKIAPHQGAAPRTIFLVDFEHPERNRFSIGEEVTVQGRREKRPDAVVYVNGIALAVLELKKATVSVQEGIRQGINNQAEENIAGFFSTVQFCVAANTPEGVRYGTVGTPEKFYLEWKEDGHRAPKGVVLGEADVPAVDSRLRKRTHELKGKLEQQLLALFDKERFLDLIYNFVIFDKGVKKICRYNQYYGIKRAQQRIARVQGDPKAEGRGGIMWHTQGSGKSLTMVWLAKWLHANRPTARVLIVTDREELDEQIEDLFLGVGETIRRTRSCCDLLEVLNQVGDHFVCSLIHKFGHRVQRNGEEEEEKRLQNDYEAYIQELRRRLPRDFEAKGELIVFVDECHRTQSGMLHKAMKEIMPKATFIGFTGTPLLSKDKPTTLRTFGDYIHCYKFDEAVRDGVIVDIHYEARDVPQELRNGEKVDEWFMLNTKGLTEFGREKLLLHWANMKHLLSSKERLVRIACDIKLDFEKEPRLKSGAGNAMLVADSIYNALRYWKIFQELGFPECRPIVSYRCTAGVRRTAAQDNEEVEKAKIYFELLRLDESATDREIERQADAMESEAKALFKKTHPEMKLLIVVDKLLTGFDAPPCSRLYIDKQMHDHGLFQAICRVNRVHDKDKLFGTIVDYRGLFEDVQDTILLYSRGPLRNYDPEDVAGLIKNHAKELDTTFGRTLEGLESLCEGVPAPRGEVEYIRFFCKWNDDSDTRDEAELAAKRKILYHEAGALLRLYAELTPVMDELDYTQEQKDEALRKTRFYVALRGTIGRASGDFVDMESYDPGMRFLLDNYVRADDAAPVGTLTEVSLAKFIDQVIDQVQEEKTPYDDPERTKREESTAESIENNLRKEIVKQQTVNPALYQRLSEMLEAVINQRKRKLLGFVALLKKYRDIESARTQPGEDDFFPAAIRESSSLRRLYENYTRDEGLVLRLDQTIRESLIDGWRENTVAQQRIKRNLRQLLGEPEEVEKVFSLMIAEKTY